jgi:hypothetical protein
MALPATPSDTRDYTAAVTAGYLGQRCDPLPDVLYTVGGGAGGTSPKFTGITPGSGVKAGATALSLTGTGLTGTEKVAVGQKLATAVTVVDDGHVTANSPAGEGARQNVTVAKTGGQASLPGAWTYT